MKKNRLIFPGILFLLFFNYYSANAQINFQIEVENTNFQEAKQTPDSGYIFVGGLLDKPPANKILMCLIKTDANGDTMWTRLFEEPESAVGFSVVMTNDNDYVVAGCSFPPDGASDKFYLIKINSSGDTLWTKKLGGLNNETLNRAQNTFDNGFILSGITNSFGQTFPDIYVVKTDSNGVAEWSRTFGSGLEDRSYSVIQTADSGYVVLGALRFGTNDCDIALIKLNATGDTLWTRTYGSGNINSEIPFSVKETLDHGLAITGSINGNGLMESAFILVTDSVGNIEWSNIYGANVSSFYISQTSDSGYVIAGRTFDFGITNPSPYILKVDPQGNFLWSKVYNGLDYGIAVSVEPTFDNGFIVCGSENEIMKLDANGSSNCLEQSVITNSINLPIITLNNNITATAVSTQEFITQTVVKSAVGHYIVCTNVGNPEIVQQKKEVRVIPNPSSGIFTFDLPLSEVGSIEIYNQLGEIVLERDISSELNNEIRLENAASGIYFIRIFDGTDYYFNKIMIENK